MISREFILNGVAPGGNLPNTKIVYDYKGIVIIKVNRFEDCHTLFDSCTSWCISHKKVHWDDYYIGREQYFILDFNKLNGDGGKETREAAIGFTIKRDNEGINLYAAHDVLDYNLLDPYEKRTTGLHPFEKILKEKGVYSFVIKNKMNPEKAILEYKNPINETGANSNKDVFIHMLLPIICALALLILKMLI